MGSARICERELHSALAPGGICPAKDYRPRLLAQRKLILLVDLDLTLVHTTDEHVDENVEGIHHYGSPNDGGRMHTRVRPGTEEFLANVSQLFEMHVVTFGNRPYANEIVSFLDPTGEFFNSRILSRDESVSLQSKSANLKRMFPFGDEMVCMIDDRKDVWRYAPNLVPVRPYIFFKGVGDINAPPRSAPEFHSAIDSDDDDDYLFFLEGILREVHGRFFEELEQSPTMPDLKKIVPGVRGRPLEGAVIAYSGCFPKNQSLDTFDICSLAVSLGAKICEELTDEVTHLIAARPDTRKVRRARKMGRIEVVTEDWLWCSADIWKRADTEHFLLRDTDEMIAKRDAKRESKLERKERRKASKRERREMIVPSDGELEVVGRLLKKLKCDPEHTEVPTEA